MAGFLVKIDRIMRRAFLNKSSLRILFGIFIFLLFAGVFSYPVNAEAAPLIKMNPGQSKTMKLPGGWKNVRWSSNKKTVVRINKRGVVKAAAPGKAVVTAKAGKNTKKYKIKVQMPQLSSSKLTMKVGETKKLTVKNALGKVSWSSDGKAARVNSKGKITAMKEGETIITASVFGKKYKCTVKVKDGGQEAEPETYKVRITVGNQQFSAVLCDNETARAFVKKLPMTIRMDELNGNEKYYYFSESLPTDSRKPEKIHTGDIMLYGSDCLVLFYDDFFTAYSYTPIGSISNPDGLAKALGSGNVRVSFSLE